MADNKIVKSASAIMLFSLIAKFSSFLVELLVASNLGVSKETDSFYMVYGIVQIIYPMISVGIWKVFLPEYKTRLVLGRENDATDITSKLITFFSLVAGVIILLTLGFPELFIKLFAPGFDPGTILISSNLLRIVIFILLFNIIATFSSAILQSHGRFSKAQLKEVIFHIPSVLYLLVYRSEASVTGLALSIVIGAIVASINGYILSRSYYKFSVPGKILDNNVLKILKNVPVTCLNSIINQLNNVIDRVFSSWLPTGAVTYLNYGGKLIHLFDGIFSTAISTALFPYLTELVAKEEYDKLRGLLKRYIVLICMILLPITAIIIIYSNEIVEVVFGHGKFDKASVDETAMVLLMYGLGLLFMCMTTVVNDIFYILKRNKLLLISTVINIISNIILDFIFVDIWGVAGLSLATTISLFVALFIKHFYIRDIHIFDWELIKHIITVIVYCGISVGAVIIFNIMVSLVPLLRLSLGIIIFFVFYISLTLGLNKEMRAMFVSLIKDLKNKKKKS